MSSKQASGRSWWTTWPGALALGLVSLAMVAVTGTSLLLISLLVPLGTSGTDLTDVAEPATGWRIAWGIAGVACLALPFVVVAVARRRWLGWTLVLLALSTFALTAGLWALGVL